MGLHKDRLHELLIRVIRLALVCAWRIQPIHLLVSALSVIRRSAIPACVKTMMAHSILSLCQCKAWAFP